MGVLTDFTGLPRDKFIELGTGRGDTLNQVIHASPPFQQIYSIEWDKGLWQMASARWSKLIATKRLTLINDDSRNALRYLLEPSTPTTIWADAHWSGGFYGEMKPPVECPLMDELAQINVLDWTVPVTVIVDDLRVFGENWWSTDEAYRIKYSPYAWPKLSNILDMLERWEVEEKGDMLVARMNQ